MMPLTVKQALSCALKNASKIKLKIHWEVGECEVGLVGLIRMPAILWMGISLVKGGYSFTLMGPTDTSTR